MLVLCRLILYTSEYFPIIKVKLLYKFAGVTLGGVENKDNSSTQELDPRAALVEGPSEEDDDQLFDSVDLDQLETFGRETYTKSSTDMKRESIVESESYSDSESDEEDDLPQFDGPNDRRGRGRPPGKGRGKAQPDKGSSEESPEKVNVRQSMRIRNLESSTVEIAEKDKEQNMIQTGRKKAGNVSQTPSRVGHSSGDTDSPRITRGRGRPPKRTVSAVRTEESDEFDSTSEVGSPTYKLKTKTKLPAENKVDEKSEVELSQSPDTKCSISFTEKDSPRVSRGRDPPTGNKVKSGGFHSLLLTGISAESSETERGTVQANKAGVTLSQSPSTETVAGKESPKTPRGRGRLRKRPLSPVVKYNESNLVPEINQSTDMRSVKDNTTQSAIMGQPQTELKLLRLDTSDDTQSDIEALVIDCDIQSPRGHKVGVLEWEDAPASPEASASPDAYQSPTNKPLTIPKIIPLSPDVLSDQSDGQSQIEPKTMLQRRHLRSSVDLSEIPSTALAMSPRKRKKFTEIKKIDNEAEGSVQKEYVC